MSSTLNRSSALQHFEHGNVVEIHNLIVFGFYLGLPHNMCVYLAIGCAEEEERAYYLETQAARKQQKKLKGRGKMKKRGQDKVCVWVTTALAMSYVCAGLQ